MKQKQIDSPSMNIKKSNQHSKLPLLFMICCALLIGFFYIYEITTIKNPFMDPIAPYILWGSMLLIITLIIIKIIKINISMR